MSNIVAIEHRVIDLDLPKLVIKVQAYEIDFLKEALADAIEKNVLAIVPFSTEMMLQMPVIVARRLARKVLNVYADMIAGKKKEYKLELLFEEIYFLDELLKEKKFSKQSILSAFIAKNNRYYLNEIEAHTEEEQANEEENTEDSPFEYD